MPLPHPTPPTQKNKIKMEASNSYSRLGVKALKFVMNRKNAMLSK